MIVTKNCCFKVIVQGSGYIYIYYGTLQVVYPIKLVTLW